MPIRPRHLSLRRIIVGVALVAMAAVLVFAPFAYTWTSPVAYQEESLDILEGRIAAPVWSVPSNAAVEAHMHASGCPRCGRPIHVLTVALARKSLYGRLLLVALASVVALLLAPIPMARE